MNPRKSTSSFSKREKMRRNPFKRRNRRSISFRRLLDHRPRVRHGCQGYTGTKPSGVALVGPVHQQVRSALRAQWVAGHPGMEGYGSSSAATMGGPTASGLAGQGAGDGTMVLSMPTARWTICSRSGVQTQHSVLGPAVHPSVDGMPVAEARRQASPLAARQRTG